MNLSRSINSSFSLSVTAVIFGPLFYYVKKVELKHRVESPIITLLAHLFGLSGVYALLYHLGGLDLGCECHSLPILKGIGGALLLIRGLITLISRVHLFGFESHFCNHDHDSRDYVEKFFEDSFITTLVLIFFMYECGVNYFLKKNLMVLSAMTLYFILFSILIYTYLQILTKKVIFRTTKNYKKAFTVNMIQTLLLSFIVLSQGLNDLGYHSLGLALTVNLAIKELIELIGCSYSVYRDYNIYQIWTITDDLSKNLLVYLKEFVKITFTVVSHHLLEHISASLYLNNAFYAGLASISEIYTMIIYNLLYKVDDATKESSCCDISC